MTVKQADSQETQDATQVEAQTEDSVNETQEIPEGFILKSDLDRMITKAIQTRQANWEKEYREKIEAKEKQLEEERLQEQGKFQELLERKSQELDALKAKVQSSEFRTEAEGIVEEYGLGAFKNILVAGRKSMDEVRDACEEMKALKDVYIQEGVEKRLETGTRKTNSGTPVGHGVKFSDLKTRAQKVEFIKEHGQEAFEKLVYQGG
jgi:hypothetical protein